MLSLFVLLKVDLVISILFAIFSAFIMTGKSNIQDMYLWNTDGTPSKYADVAEYVKYNRGNYNAGEDSMEALEDTMRLFTEFAHKMIKEVEL